MGKPKPKPEYENSIAEDLIEDEIEGNDTSWFWGD